MKVAFLLAYDTSRFQTKRILHVLGLLELGHLDLDQSECLAASALTSGEVASVTIGAAVRVIGAAIGILSTK